MINTARTRRGHRARLALLAPLMALGAGLAMLTGASPAAAASTYTHNNYYSYSALKNTPHVYSGGVIANLYNNTNVSMQCWIDTENVTDRNYSNYNSPRWFRVSVPSGQVGYVHSSYVQGTQPTVGHC